MANEKVLKDAFSKAVREYAFSSLYTAAFCRRRHKLMKQSTVFEGGAKDVGCSPNHDNSRGTLNKNPIALVYGLGHVHCVLNDCQEPIHSVLTIRADL